MQSDGGSSKAVLDGRLMPLAEAALSILDDGAARGDGAFETVGVWDGRPFRLDDHLGRLDLSLKRLCLPAAPRGALVGDTRMVLQDVGAVDAALRLYVTASGTRLVTLAPPPVRPQPASLEAQPAPWIRPLGTWGPAGAKTMSYAPNMAATRAAVRAGADDALLVSLEGWVLEGPTFAVLWVAGGTLRAPAPDLGIVDSISRRTVLELATAAGIPVGEGRWRLADLEQSDEVMACSSVRPLVIVGRIGERRLDGPTPVRDRLAAALDDARRSGGDR